MAFDYRRYTMSSKIHKQILDVVDNVILIGGVVGCGKTTDAIINISDWCAKVCPMDDGKPLEANVLVVRQDQSKIKSSFLKDLKRIFGSATDDIIKMDYPIVIDKLPWNTVIDGKPTTVLITWTLMGVANEVEIDEKMRAMNMTALVIDEAQTYPNQHIVSAGSNRTGRSPNLKTDMNGDVVLDGSGYMSQKLTVVLYNPPPEGHWIHKAKINKDGKSCPPSWKFINYPSPIIPITDPDGNWIDFEANEEPDADFVKINAQGAKWWINQARDLLAIGDLRKISVDLMGNFGSTFHGKAVFPSFKDEIHILKQKVRPDVNRLTFIGYDHSGTNNGAVIAQRSPTMGLVAMGDVFAPDTTSDDFIELYLFPKLLEMGITDKNKMLFILDPKDPKQNVKNSTIRDILHKRFGVPRANIRYPMDVLPIRRREAFQKNLVGMDENQFRVSPDCDILIEALRGKYCFEKIRNTERWKNEPDAEKLRPWSDVVDSLLQIATYIQLGQHVNKSQVAAPPPRARYGVV